MKSVADLVGVIVFLGMLVLLLVYRHDIDYFTRQVINSLR